MADRDDDDDDHKSICPRNVYETRGTMKWGDAYAVDGPTTFLIFSHCRFFPLMLYHKWGSSEKNIEWWT